MNDEIVFHFFLRTFFSKILTYTCGGRKQRLVSGTNKQFQMILKNKFCSSTYPMCLHQLSAQRGQALWWLWMAHSQGVFPQVLEDKQYHSKNQQSGTQWISNCEHPPDLQETKLAISSSFSGHVLYYILLQVMLEESKTNIWSFQASGEGHRHKNASLTFI